MAMQEGRARAIRVGLVGVGTIGREICRALDERIPGLELVGVSSRDLKRAVAFANSLHRPCPVLSLDELVERSDLVVETATGEALQQIAPRALQAGKDLMVLSVGGLLGHEDWFQLAREKGCRIYVPSGALAGLDGVLAARAGQIRAVTLESRKPPRGLSGAPFVVARGIDLDALREETLLFEGNVFEACAGFPANVNVSAALSLAGIGAEKTRVKIFAVPGATRNVHDVVVEGDFGLLRTHIENVPSEGNPRSGRLAYLSPIALLRSLTGPLRIGN
ncbi:MAG: aspartate dehydrogenase [Acidobacteria bacterium]|nr:aspartate dehydrogenase [Acidobacteriota bacterium]